MLAHFKQLKQELCEIGYSGTALSELMEILEKHFGTPILSQMDEFERQQLADNITLVKEGGGSFMLVFLDSQKHYRGDISINKGTDDSDGISIAFNPDVELTITKPSWNGIILRAKPEEKGNK